VQIGPGLLQAGHVIGLVGLLAGDALRRFCQLFFGRRGVFVIVIFLLATGEQARLLLLEPHVAAGPYPDGLHIGVEQGFELGHAQLEAGIIIDLRRDEAVAERDVGIRAQRHAVCGGLGGPVVAAFVQPRLALGLL